MPKTSVLDLIQPSLSSGYNDRGHARVRKTVNMPKINLMKIDESSISHTELGKHPTHPEPTQQQYPAPQLVSLQTLGAQDGLEAGQDAQGASIDYTHTHPTIPSKETVQSADL